MGPWLEEIKQELHRMHAAAKMCKETMVMEGIPAEMGSTKESAIGMILEEYQNEGEMARKAGTTRLSQGHGPSNNIFTVLVLHELRIRWRRLPVDR
jgi:hypothetical protein